MPPPDPPAVGCFSYLAAVQTLHVARFPRLDYGTETLSRTRFLAGDGPLVAAALHALGRPALLGANQPGDDPEGRAIRGWLDRQHLAPAGGPPASLTRVNIVVCDDAGNRTWFSGLRGIEEELKAVDTTALAAAPAVYIDCYEALGTAPRDLLAAALHSGAEILLNLGGSPPPPWLTTTAGKRRVSILQTSASENDPAAQAAALDALADLDIAETVIVTAGRHGAAARARGGRTIAVPALPVRAGQVQGAGAIFSAALIHSGSTGASLPARLRYACTAGSLWCSQPAGQDLPDPGAIKAAVRTGPGDSAC